jgi:acetylornithine deacetylase/succinyl-diaminopimelate desuccinylase-like protein
VKTDTFTQPPSERIAQPTAITNVYAVLKGSGAGPPERIVLVTGHYDARNSDNFDVEHDAPGANDDASGTAVSLECARVLGGLHFPATIISLAVAGEEQGLYGSAHFAKAARAAGWNIDAVLAAAPATPGHAALITAKLDNDTTLRWDPTPGAGGYEILWRATDRPDWEHTQNVGSRTEVTLPVSKDNVVFAVRAVDPEGRRSLAVVPEPQR